MTDSTTNKPNPFLATTLEYMVGFSLSPDDVVFVGSLHSGHGCTWAQFETLSEEFSGDAFSWSDAEDVASDLAIVFSNGDIMRWYYNEDYEWLHVPAYDPDKEVLPITKIMSTRSLENTLADMNVVKEPGPVYAVPGTLDPRHPVIACTFDLQPHFHIDVEDTVLTSPALWKALVNLAINPTYHKDSNCTSALRDLDDLFGEVPVVLLDACRDIAKRFPSTASVECLDVKMEDGYDAMVTAYFVEGDLLVEASLEDGELAETYSGVLNPKHVTESLQFFMELVVTQSPLLGDEHATGDLPEECALVLRDALRAYMQTGTRVHLGYLICTHVMLCAQSKNLRFVLKNGFEHDDKYTPLLTYSSKDSAMLFIPYAEGVSHVSGLDNVLEWNGLFESLKTLVPTDVTAFNLVLGLTNDTDNPMTLADKMLHQFDLWGRLANRDVTDVWCTETESLNTMPDDIPKGIKLSLRLTRKDTNQ